jgi:hypothetical protein
MIVCVILHDTTNGICSNGIRSNVTTDMALFWQICSINILLSLSQFAKGINQLPDSDKLKIEQQHCF